MRGRWFNDDDTGTDCNLLDVHAPLILVHFTVVRMELINYIKEKETCG